MQDTNPDGQVSKAAQGRLARAASVTRANPTKAPDYSSLRGYEATAEELARFGVSDIPSLVRKFNADFVRARLFPVTQSDYPGTKKRFDKLVARWERLTQKA